MDKINQIVNDYIGIILISMIAVIVILFIFLLVLINSNRKLNKRYKSLFRCEGKSLEDIIEKYMNAVEEVKEKNNTMFQMHEDILSKVDTSIRKVEMKRYKAFDDVGSDLSFSIVMLDNDNNGFVLTSIFGREDSVIYAKEIESGISRYELSTEVKEVLDSAIEME